MFLGEFPPLPPDVIRQLHRRTMDIKARAISQVWDLLAESAVTVFEGWKRNQ